MIGAAKGPPPPPNYITLAGAKRLQEELGHLRSKERPKVVREVSDAAAQGDRSENAEYIYGKRRLREIDRRMHFLTRRLEKAVIVEPRTDAKREDLLRRDRGGRGRGLREGDLPDRRRGRDRPRRSGRISWRSPLGRALLGKKEDDTVVFRKPSGEVELTILAVRY